MISNLQPNFAKEVTFCSATGGSGGPSSLFHWKARGKVGVHFSFFAPRSSPQKKNNNNSSNGRLFGHHSYANELYCFFWLLIGWTFRDLVLSCLGKPTNRKYPKARLGCSEIESEIC